MKNKENLEDIKLEDIDLEYTNLEDIKLKYGQKSTNKFLDEARHDEDLKDIFAFNEVDKKEMQEDFSESEIEEESLESLAKRINKRKPDLQMKNDCNRSGKVDWVKIEIEYVTTTISFRKLCVKYNIPFDTLKKQAAKNEWYLKRVQFGNKRATKIQDAICDIEAKAIAKLKKRERFMFGLIEKMLMRQVLYLIENRDSPDFDSRENLSQTQALCSIAKTICLLQDGIYTSYNLHGKASRCIQDGFYRSYGIEEKQKADIVLTLKCIK